MDGQWVPDTSEQDMNEQTMALVKLHGLTVEKSCLKNPDTGLVWMPVIKRCWINGVMHDEHTWMWISLTVRAWHTTPIEEALTEWAERGYPTS